MNKRDTIVVVFRVVAVFVFFVAIATVPSVYGLWVTSAYVGQSFASMLVRALIMVGVPLGIGLLLWNRSGWVADKILAPFGMDELWDGEPQTDEVSDENNLPRTALMKTHQTITYLKRDEMEMIVLTAIGVWAIVNSLPEVLRWIYLFATSNAANPAAVSSDLTFSIPAIAKTLLGFWLLLRSSTLVIGLSRWRKLRVDEGK